MLLLTLSLEQRQMFLEEMKIYIETTQQEQECRLSGAIPTVEEYWVFRMGTSAVGVCLAVIEWVFPYLVIALAQTYKTCRFAYRTRAPRAITRDPVMKTVCDETNIIVVM
jgi:hypothetical protein